LPAQSIQNGRYCLRAITTTLMLRISATSVATQDYHYHTTQQQFKKTILQ